MTQTTDRQSNLWMRIKKYKWLYAFLLPGVVILLLFAYMPMAGMVMAFQKYDPVSGFFGSEWVGFENFVRIFSTPVFGRAFRNTIIISLLKLLICFPLPIVVSLLINELRHRKFKRTLQTIIYLPNFVSWVIAAGIWYSLLGENGVVNNILMLTGLADAPTLFMQEKSMFYPIIILTDLWKNLGYNTIFYIAAFSSIPLELYEAADIDGASRLQKALRITVPSVSKTIMLLFILQVGGLLSAGFDQMWTMSNLAVREIADIIDTAVLRTLTSGSLNDLSTSAALSMFKSVIGLMLFGITNAVSNKLDQGSLV